MESEYNTIDSVYDTFNLIVLLLAIVLVLVVVPRFLFYTPEGDINNFYSKDIKREYSDEKLLNKLYRLSIYDYCKVRWHYIFILSLVSAIFILYLIDSFSLRNLIILALAFFIVIEVPTRLENGHIKSKTANKATLIYSTLMERHNNNDYENSYNTNESNYNLTDYYENYNNLLDYNYSI